MFGFASSEAIVPLRGFPQSSLGAPCPSVIASEQTLVVVFYAEPDEPEWNGETTRMVDLRSPGEPVVVVKFEGPTVHLFGPPNDEAFSGHRLAAKGLEPYGAFEVIRSEWISQLERMNSVHPRHNKKRFLEGKRHFILTFHDSTFECVATGYQIKHATGSLTETVKAQAGGLDA